MAFCFCSFDSDSDSESEFGFAWKLAPSNLWQLANTDYQRAKSRYERSVFHLCENFCCSLSRDEFWFGQRERERAGANNSPIKVRSARASKRPLDCQPRTQRKIFYHLKPSRSGPLFLRSPFVMNSRSFVGLFASGLGKVLPANKLNQAKQRQRNNRNGRN